MIDYPGRRESGHISDLCLEEQGFDVRYAMRSPLPRELSARAYAGRLIERSGVDRNRLVGIAAYCMAGHIAHEAAAQLSADGTEPVTLILFDSGPCLADAVAEECRSALDLFGGAELTAVLDHGPGPGLLSAESLRDAPERSVALIERELLDFAINLYPDAAENRQEAEEAAAPMVDHFIEWLSHLVAAHNGAAPAWPGQVLHLVSRDHPYREDWPGARSTTTRLVDRDRNMLLAAKEVRDIVISQFRSRSA
ncbi:hypothetical protein [Micromonospora haikouensis]|uniref:hypothetical protein n=1 Tax=Micromonospora haikouensis TaxID=686309 RepID=UPI003D74ACAA